MHFRSSLCLLLLAASSVLGDWRKDEEKREKKRFKQRQREEKKMRRKRPPIFNLEEPGLDVIGPLWAGEGAPSLYPTDLAPWQQHLSIKEPSETRLRCFQVSSPVLDRKGLVVGDEYLQKFEEPYPACDMRLLDDVTFANSYGHPYVVKYQVPKCPFKRIVLNMTVTSAGHQFDRLGSLWIGDVEAWRFSTAEPNAAPGIVWTQWKDVSYLQKLFTSDQIIILDLGNLVNEKYTAPYKVTLTARFFDHWASDPSFTTRPADRIEAITAKRSQEGKGSAWNYNGQPVGISLQLPRNIYRAVITIAATGQGDEEFWWSNVPDDAVYVFAPEAKLTGNGGFREVRVYIDGHLVGLVYPFPIVFTGGISPPMHRPLVGPQVFDLREHQIDVTPWMGLLCNGQPHNVSIAVLLQNGKAAPGSWIISGKMFLWLGAQELVNTGETPRIKLLNKDGPPLIDAKLGQYVTYRHVIERSLTVEAQVVKGNTVQTLFWNQTFIGKSRGFVARNGHVQHVHSIFHGEDTSMQDNLIKSFVSYTYPIASSFDSSSPEGYKTVSDSNLTHGEEFVFFGRNIFPTGLECFEPKFHTAKGGTGVSNLRSARGLFFQRDNGSSFGFGSACETFRLNARPFYYDVTSPMQIAEPQLYSRNVVVVNESIVEDEWHLYTAKNEVHDKDSWRMYRPQGPMHHAEAVTRPRPLDQFSDNYSYQVRLPKVKRRQPYDKSSAHVEPLDRQEALFG